MSSVNDDRKTLQYTSTHRRFVKKSYIGNTTTWHYDHMLKMSEISNYITTQRANNVHDDDIVFNIVACILLDNVVLNLQDTITLINDNVLGPKIYDFMHEKFLEMFDASITCNMFNKEYAIDEKHYDIDEYLLSQYLKKGVNINHKNSFGDTILVKACMRNNTNLVVYLLNKGIDVDQCSDDLRWLNIVKNTIHNIRNMVKC